MTWKEALDTEREMILRGSTKQFLSLSLSLSIYLSVCQSFCLSICGILCIVLWCIVAAVTLCIYHVSTSWSYWAVTHHHRTTYGVDEQAVNLCAWRSLCLIETHCEGSRCSEVHSTRRLGACHTPTRWLLRARHKDAGWWDWKLVYCKVCRCMGHYDGDHAVIAA